MKVKIHKKNKSKKGLLVVPFFKEDLEKTPGSYPQQVKDFLKTRVKNKEFRANRKETILTYLSAKGLPPKLLLIGCGKKGNYSAVFARELGAKIGKSAKKTESLSIFLAEKMLPHTEELLEGIIMSRYKFDLYKTGKKKSTEIKDLHLIAESKKGGLGEAAQKAHIICVGIDYIKDLVNSPSNIVDGEYFTKEARRIAKENKYKIAVLGNKDLKKMGCGGILAVNQGSRKEPKLVVLQYDGGKRGEKPVVIVGKGVIFDSGGYNLKPINQIETMQQDMAGGAVVLGIFAVLKKLGIKKNIMGVIPVVENMVSDTAYKPSDIIRMFSGKTVEITNTDAEGRLILADAITYGTKLNPELLITIATLTSAVDIAVGDRYCGLIGNNIPLRRAVQKAGCEVDDLGWPLPLHRDYKNKIKSEVADFRNYDRNSGRHAGCSKGAAFLEKFVEKNKWCHIDIGGSAFTDDPKEYQSNGATAHGFRMLIRFLEKV